MTEKQVVRALKNLAKKWPSDLWLFATGETLWVMRCSVDGKRAMNQEGGVDHNYIIDSIDIPSDGGDW